MAGIYPREAVRVKVKKCEPTLPPEWRKFSVDPQITTLEVLYSLLAKAFDIKTDFSIKYKAYDPAGNEIYLAVLSDWDLDAAFLRIHNISIQTASEPCLILQIDVKPFTLVRDCESESPSSTSRANSIAGTTTVPNAPIGGPSGSAARDLMSPLQSLGVSQKYVQHMQTKLPGLIMNQMEKTFSIVQKAFNLSEETMANLPPRPPMSDNEFRLFLDALGQIQRNDELRKVIFLGGIEPSLRRVVWKHLLNVYPSGMNGHQRMEFMRRKSEHYYKLRDTWKAAIKRGSVVGELAYVTSMVKKDVLRTDRLHPFYAGNDDNQSIASLFNILTTYALNHPTVSYCQGMSDIASPLLVTMNDEAQAYICFCAIMARVGGNFMLDGIAMTQKFTHLTEALSFYDPEFWDYLKSQQADDLLFCYRWLLLELKREFPFEDSLRMLEVQWSSLRYDDRSGDKELPLFEKEFVPFVDASAPNSASTFSGSYSATPTSPSYLLTKPRENPYTKVCALRRQSSSASLSSLSSSLGASNLALNASKLDNSKRLNHSLDDNMSRHAARRQRRASAKAHQSLDESKMLALIEGAMENTKSSHELSASEDTDDDVFDKRERVSSTASPPEFHETNPFKDDANQNVEEIATKPPTRAFLCSSSSSNMEEECSTAQGFAKRQQTNILTNYSTVSNMIAKQLASNASNVSESVKRVSSSSGGHFKDLKEKIAATSRMGISFDGDTENKNPPKLVKNFNEFLNFATINKNRISDRFANQLQISENQHQQQQSVKPTSPKHQQISKPIVQLTKTGFGTSLDESDSSSIPETTWSASTAATAIQQAQNLSNYSLQLDLNSISPISEQTPPQAQLQETQIDDVIGREESSTPDQDQEYYPMTTAITRELRLDAENLDRQVFGVPFTEKQMPVLDDIEYEKLGKDTLDMVDDLKENEIITCPDVSELHMRRKQRLAAKKSNSVQQQSESQYQMNPFIDETMLLEDGHPTLGLRNSNSLPEVIMPISTEPNLEVPTLIEIGTNADDESAFTRSPQKSELNGLSNTTTALPPPREFGGGNAFLMFLCLTLLLQHRNTIMKAGMDYNEIAMHFDKMVRKHNVTRVLNQARRMYIDYLRQFHQ
ncbi:TBC1 domain family member 25 [Scaptodrosophila lebanonensis]|uniref:TBC1 domain family member 25 n=1 Tax=Drosophila lebanonensis TaxID=7225 RepID=A0A6J2UJE6_DROLE|nr:TBC1 domain family member 25 [Scaptodrosophila lebanonensis]